MKKLFVEKSVEINAPPEKVWAALTQEELTKKWVGEFGIDGSVESEWRLGSPVFWKDVQGQVLVEGYITSVKPRRKAHFTVHDLEENVFEAYESDKDGITYVLEKTDGHTLLSVSQGDFGKVPGHEKYYGSAVAVWDRVLPKIKELAEKM